MTDKAGLLLLAVVGLIALAMLRQVIKPHKETRTRRPDAEPPGTLDLLPKSAKLIVDKLAAAGFTVTAERQALCIGEESGEAVGAIRRYLGFARRKGTKQEAAHELANLIITVFVEADLLDIDLTEAIDEKLETIFARPWRES